jgi:hypothetical protein
MPTRHHLCRIAISVYYYCIAVLLRCDASLRHTAYESDIARFIGTLLGPSAGDPLHARGVEEMLQPYAPLHGSLA